MFFLASSNGCELFGLRSLRLSLRLHTGPGSAATIICGLLLSGPLVSTPQSTFRSDVNLVNILATVHDHTGRIISELTKNDLILMEDGRRQAIHDLIPQSDLPLTIGLLVDTSGSMRRALDEKRQASRELLKSALRPGCDRALIISFDETLITAVRSCKTYSGFRSRPVPPWDSQGKADG